MKKQRWVILEGKGLIVKILLAGFFAALSSVAIGQAYPQKPVRIIVAAAPGGGTDFVGRLIASKLSELFPQQFIVDNRPGAGSMLGFELGIKSPNDGYTLILITPSYSINPALYPVKFDPLTDFTPVSTVARGPLVLAVHPSLPAKNMKQFLQLTKKNPDQMVYGTSGQGGIVHLATAQFLYMAGLRMTQVPYKGGGPALNDLIAGQVSMVFVTPQAGLPQVKAGRIRALAVTTAARLPAEPKIPTLAEAGVAGYEVNNWHALIGPKGLAPMIVEPLNAAVNKIIHKKEMEERLRGDGVYPFETTPSELFELIRKELQMWRHVVKVADIKIQ